MEETATEGNSTGHGTERKRRKLKQTEDVLKISLDESAVAALTVVRKSKNDVLQTFEGPVVSGGEGKMVSLFKDCRERFKVPSKQKHPGSRPVKERQTGSQKAVAVVVSSQSAERIYGDTPPLATLSNSHDLPSRSRDFRFLANGTNSATDRRNRTPLL